jgi:hypothetical protein
MINNSKNNSKSKKNRKLRDGFLNSWARYSKKKSLRLKIIKKANKRLRKLIKLSLKTNKKDCFC